MVEALLLIMLSLLMLCAGWRLRGWWQLRAFHAAMDRLIAMRDEPGEA